MRVPLDHAPIVLALCARLDVPVPTPEYVFAAPRRWRFDFAWRRQKLALEVEGGIWIAGRHSRGKGMLADMTKYNAAAIRGWRVLRCTPSTLISGVEAVKACLEAK